MNLKGDGWDIDIDPAQGSLFRHCRFKDTDIFRPIRTSSGLDGFAQFHAGHFPLVPFSNRIEDGRFEFEGKAVCLPVNAPVQTHPLHGQGWLAVWQITELSQSACQLRYDHRPGDWPWAYRARQSISVSGNVLRLELSLQNIGDSPMPGGLGFHPYFPDPGAAEMRFDSQGVWLPDEQRLPEEWTAAHDIFDFSRPRSLAGLSLDHCFTGIGPAAHIAWPAKSKQLTLRYSDNLRWAALYVAKEDNCFCFEPVSHAHNAVNMDNPAGQGVVTLSPDETMTAWCEYEVSFNA